METGESGVEPQDTPDLSYHPSYSGQGSEISQATALRGAEISSKPQPQRGYRAPQPYHVSFPPHQPYPVRYGVEQPYPLVYPVVRPNLAGYPSHQLVPLGYTDPQSVGGYGTPQPYSVGYRPDQPYMPRYGPPQLTYDPTLSNPGLIPSYSHQAHRPVYGHYPGSHLQQPLYGPIYGIRQPNCNLNHGPCWGAQHYPGEGLEQPDSLPISQDQDSVSSTVEKRWTQLRRDQEAARRQRDVDEGTPPPLSSRQMEQLSATYSRATSRQLYIQRKDGGFGFTLRHFIVYPPEDGETEGPPISDPLDTIFVKSIKEAGPAVVAGLNIGDRIVTVNGESVAGRSYAQVVQMIQKSRDMLRLVVVPKQDDILQVYFSEIAQNPETNKRLEPGSSAKPPWPASVCSSSSRESSPFSSKTSDSTRDSVYGREGRQSDIRSLYPGTKSRVQSAPRPTGQHQNSEWENLYESIGNDRLKVPSVPPSGSSGSTEHVYAVPALARSSISSSTLGSGHASAPNNSRDSLDSDSSVMAGFSSHQEDSMINKIKKDCERKEEFLKTQTYPAYLSSPPKEINTNPKGIASLANTMPPPKPDPKTEEKENGGPATKNFFMDIYAKEVSKMQSVSKSSAGAKKRNFDATQFNTYGLPLGYRRGGNYYDSDNFSRNNFVIVGTRSLHCEPPQVYQPTPEPPPPVEEDERNLRRVSYLQATKEERMEPEENLTTETGLAPTHSIKKLKSIFSEKSVDSPLISSSPPANTVEPSPPSPKSIEPPKFLLSSGLDKSASSTTLNDGIKEGYLTCKVACLDGRKATDRSWKTVYAVLKAKALYMFKDKKMATENLEYEEKPVKLAESEVEVANDYTKRKNVFRVKTVVGSEYLFQAENESLMKDWVKTIDETAMAVIIDERKDVNKLKKLTSFRNRSPTGQSPSSKNRKASVDPGPNLKDKDKKNWKGKVVKQLKKMGGGGHGPLYPEGGSINVPLDECPLCPEYNDEFVPYLVKVCCDIVNEKGLEIVGIYRVPGNNAAVTYLTEQVNKGVHAFALDDYRWQDVNVVSSLLKSFFRKLPEPLFTMEMYSLFIEASKIEQPTKRLESLRRLVRDLPDIHLETLRFLTQHLCNVADHSSVNKMEIRNLAIVFGPTLVRTTDDNMISMVTDMSQQCRIIESLLSNWDYFFADAEDVEVKDELYDEVNILTGSSNQSIMLANLHKLEDAGKLNSPKNDVSAKDIVSSIISAANRKMLRSGAKSKKESTSDLEERSQSRMEDSHSDSRRESESVIHGALQIASAVPGIVGSISSSSVPETSSSPPGTSGGSRAGSDRETGCDEHRHSYSRQGSRGSISGDIFKRRGSLPVCQSKRGSICAYSGGAVCESTPVGEICEARMAMMKSDTETIENGLGENQEVVRGQLSLVNVGVKDPEPQYKFPIETYTGLDIATAERIKKFEAETKAMLTRSAHEHSGSTLQLSSAHQGRLSLDGQTHKPSELESTSSETSLNSLPQSSGRLTSLTTPVPDTNPLDGGILMEEPYQTDAYNRISGDESFLALSYRASTLPCSLEPSRHFSNHLLGFDTNKVMKRGTLQRLKIRTRGELSDDGGDLIESSSDVDIDENTEDAESLLGKLSASFDQKMRFLLDPEFREDGEGLGEEGNWSDLNQIQEQALLDAIGSKKELDDVRNAFLRDKANKKVELKRSARVDRNSEPEIRKSVKQEPVLQQVNHRKPLKRSDSLTKREKTELNQKKREVEKENKVMKLKEHFEQSGTRPRNPGNPLGSANTKFDINKVRKKLSDNKNRRIKRRHTVGGTKDFTEIVLSKMNSEKSKSSWDRLAPVISNQELIAERNERWNLEREDREERRLSLPDCTPDRPTESSV